MKKKLQRKFAKWIQNVIDSSMGNGLMQEETSASGERYQVPGMKELIRQTGAESCVLLKNEDVLPLNKDKEVAVFGRCQLDWFYVGYGSGGDVHAPYEVNLIDGLKNSGVSLNAKVAESYESWTREEDNLADHGWWGHWPMNYPEMPVNEELCREAAKTSDTALVVIGRAAGEDRENKLEAGSYYLTKEERDMLKHVTASFSKVVVLLNIGNIIDMSWMESYGDKISGLMIVWQAGQESGNAAADVLTGKVNPSGRLAATIAKSYEDYPSSANFGGKDFNEYQEGIFVGYRHFDTFAKNRVLYPFGAGLSYTSFNLEVKKLTQDGDDIRVEILVTNTGDVPGKKAVLIWCRQARGRLDKAAHVLAAFGKTRELLPGQSETLEISFGLDCIASYDPDLHAFVLEEGAYAFHADETEAGSIYFGQDQVLTQCHPICQDSSLLRDRILKNLPESLQAEADDDAYLLEHAPNLQAVKEGKISLDTFIAGLSDQELEGLTRGEGAMNSPLGTAGNAGIFGGVLPSLREKGVPPIVTADGPAGLRLQKFCALLPSGTAQACTWNTDLIEQLYAKESEEMTHFAIDVRLAPGMNIQRNPLCGRNFEYFSEDPLLSGKMAAAVIRGLETDGHAACPKHFACNNQETRRNTNDSRVSERALREIYLRNFEIAVKEGHPKTIMTSYNKVNGVWSHYHYDLVTTVLRKEWGYDGMVMTDWWMQKSKSPEFPRIRDNAYRVRAGVDVLMPGDMHHFAKTYKSDGTLLKTLDQKDGITRGELQDIAKHVLKLALEIK